MKHPLRLIPISLILAALAIAPTQAASAAKTQPAELRVGVFPDADSLPLLVAEAEGLFAREGVNVKLVPFKTAVERDAALQAGAVDGVISDLLAAVLATQGGFEVRVTSLTDGRYGIVAAPGSGIDRATDLAGVEIGLSTNTIIQYAVDSLLTKAGLASADIRGLAVPKIPVRMELLMSGQLKAACLPEPLLTAATERGAKLLAASDDAGLRAGVLLFSKAAVDTRLPDLKAFYRAYAAAAAAINADEAKYRPFLVDKAGFPAEVKDAYRFVRYASPRLPTEADVSAVLAWMRAKGLLKVEIVPLSILDGRALSDR